jgi:RimJ/RimL family protein N-acetyltransferase
LLRRWRPSDAAAYAAIWEDEHVRRALAPGRPVAPADAAAAGLARQLRQWERDGFGLWAAIPHDSDGTPVGWIGAWRQDVAPELAGEIEIAWTLRRPWWGRGLATEGAELAVAVAFEHLRPPRVVSLIAAGNDRSVAVALRLGMSYGGETHHREGPPLAVYALNCPR